MNSKETKSKLTSKEIDINALARFITPVHNSLQHSPKEVSLSEVSDFKQREAFVNQASIGLTQKGKNIFQSELFENLHKAELALQQPSSVTITDSEHFAHLVSSLKSSGLFTMAKSVELLLAKTKLVKNVSNVIISKRAKTARKAKGKQTTQEMRRAIEDYKAKLKSWAIRKYDEDCQYREQRGELKRAKRSGEFAANTWLLGMAEDDLSLDSYEPTALSDAFIEGLTDEGNYHGSPEQPDHLLDFKLTATFFYSCIKNIK